MFATSAPSEDAVYYLELYSESEGIELRHYWVDLKLGADYIYILRVRHAADTCCDYASRSRIAITCLIHHQRA